MNPPLTMAAQMWVTFSDSSHVIVVNKDMSKGPSKYDENNVSLESSFQ